MWANQKRLGTKMHRDIEQYYTMGCAVDMDDPCMKQFVDFCGTHPHLPVLVEKQICSPELGLAGTIDALLQTPDGKTVLVDWKRAKISKQSYGHSTRIPFLPNSKYHRYMTQLIVYAQILRQHDLDIDELWLVGLHPDQKRFKLHQLLPGEIWQVPTPGPILQDSTQANLTGPVSEDDDTLLDSNIEYEQPDQTAESQMVLESDDARSQPIRALWDTEEGKV